MKNLWIFILILLTGCNDYTLKEKELSLKEKELELREQELASKENAAFNPTEANTNSVRPPSVPEVVIQQIPQTNNKKFIYILLKAKQPTLLTITNKQEYVTDGDGFSSPIGDKFSYETIMETNYYTSAVIEVSDYTKDKQFKLMDKFEFQILDKMQEDDRSYRFDVNTKAGLDREKHYNNKSYIADRRCYVFDTYEQASIHSKKDERSKFN